MHMYIHEVSEWTRDWKSTSTACMYLTSLSLLVVASHRHLDPYCSPQLQNVTPTTKEFVDQLKCMSEVLRESLS